MSGNIVVRTERRRRGGRDCSPSQVLSTAVQPRSMLWLLPKRRPWEMGIPTTAKITVVGAAVGRHLWSTSDSRGSPRRGDNNHCKRTLDNVNHHRHLCNGSDNNNNENKGPPPPIFIDSLFTAVSTDGNHVDRMCSKWGGDTSLITATLTAMTMGH